jgi:hypothetical protein
MKKKVIGILVCVMVLAMMPMAAGLGVEKESSVTGPTQYLDKTLIRGIVLFPRSSIGGDFKFFAVRLHYTTISLGGIKCGTILLRSITLPDIPTGFVGNFYLMGSFRGNLDAYT